MTNRDLEHLVKLGYPHVGLIQRVNPRTFSLESRAVITCSGCTATVVIELEGDTKEPAQEPGPDDSVLRSYLADQGWRYVNGFCPVCPACATIETSETIQPTAPPRVADTSAELFSVFCRCAPQDRSAKVPSTPPPLTSHVDVLLNCCPSASSKLDHALQYLKHERAAKEIACNALEAVYKHLLGEDRLCAACATLLTRCGKCQDENALGLHLRDVVRRVREVGSVRTSLSQVDSAASSEQQFTNLLQQLHPVTPRS